MTMDTIAHKYMTVDTITHKYMTIDTTTHKYMTAHFLSLVQTLKQMMAGLS
jgi:hypothetical protein